MALSQARRAGEGGREFSPGVMRHCRAVSFAYSGMILTKMPSGRVWVPRRWTTPSRVKPRSMAGVVGAAGSGLGAGVGAATGKGRSGWMTMGCGALERGGAGLSASLRSGGEDKALLCFGGEDGNWGLVSKVAGVGGISALTG